MKIAKNSSIAPFALTFLLLLSACSQEKSTTENPKQKIESPPTVTIETPKVEEVKSYDGPFGLKMGLTIDEVKKIIPDIKPIDGTTAEYQSTTVPIPHPNFEGYSMQFSEKSGLCFITGIGKDIKSSDFGTEIKSTFNSLDEALSEKYGKGKKFDVSTERYKSPEFWMLYLYKKNHTLAKFWDKESKSTLPSDIDSLFIKAFASSINTGHIGIRYEFKNINDCIKEEKAKTNKGL